MASVSEDTVREIKFRNSIEDVVAPYVALRKAGSNLVGLCPFHSEKTPSFTVFPKDGSFYCFGCGAGGDVIAFVRRAENLDYPSALAYLAKRAGIPLVQDDRDRESSLRRQRILSMNREAARFFHQSLLDPQKGAPGMAYLRDRRGLPLSLIRHFGLGFAPDDFGLLTDHLSRLGYRDYEMADAFLSGVSKKNGRHYDYFRNRVIFPIISPSGEVLAFGGRVMDDALPKYLNTSDTPVFKKSRTLFALNYAKKHCAEQIILCEGYMDVIALHGAGFQNAVATLGTAITSEHARLMKRYTKSVVISYDSDEAGQRAADKAFRQLGEVGLEARVLRMNGAKDPDEYIRAFGSDRFASLLNTASSEFDFRFGNILGKYDIGATEGRLKALDETVALLSTVDSETRREVYIGIAAEKLSLSPESMRRDVERRIRRGERARARENTEKLIAASQGIGDRVNTDFIKNPPAAAAEEKLLGILLLHPEYIGESEKAGKKPAPEEFFSEFGRKIYTRMLDFGGGYFDISALGETLSVEEVDRITSLKRSREMLADNRIELFWELFDRMREAMRKDSLTTEEIIRRKREGRK